MTTGHVLKVRLKKASTQSLAQRSNGWRLTAWGYSVWRARSLRLLGAAVALPAEARLFTAVCRPQGHWLDVGCSHGFYAGAALRAGARASACDLSPAMLREARRRVPGAHLLLLDAERSGLPAHSFDGVTVGATLNETASPPALLRECWRLLRPGGQLWLMYLRRSGGPAQALLGATGLTFPDRAEVHGWLGQRPDFAWEQGAVVFERYRKPGAAPQAAPACGGASAAGPHSPRPGLR